MLKIKSKKITTFLIAFVLLFSFFSVLTVSSSLDGELLKQGEPSLISNNNSNQKITAEEENIDSFDVNPASGRWETTDSLTDDLIIDSNLRLINSNNDSSTTSEYIGQRGLTKSDGKYEYRSKTEYDGDNTTEHFRDSVGNSMDFEEGDSDGIISFTNGADTYSSGNLVFTKTSSIATEYFFKFATDLNAGQGLDWKLVFKSKYSTAIGKVRINWLSISLGTGVDQTIINTGNQPTDFTVTEFELNPDLWFGEIDNILLIVQMPLVTDIQIATYDYIRLESSYDFATHDENAGIKDTWDWEDSLEYFHDDLGNVSDFNDGTTENWTISGGLGDTIENLDSEFLNITDAGGVATAIERTSLSIDASGASGFDWFTMEFNSTLAITAITISDGTNQVCTSSAGWAIDIFHLFSCDLDLDGDWTGTETDLMITFSHANAAVEIHINMVFLYDTSLGDLEGWEAANGAAFEHLYVHPEGILNIRKKTNDAGAGSPKITGLSIDTSIFDSLKIRIKNTNSITATFQDAGSSTSYASLSVTSSFQTLTEDLSADPDWTGSITSLLIRNPSVIIGELLEIDYILLLKSENETENDIFTVGLYDQDNNIPLLNVTQHYFSNDEFQWRIYVMDSQNNIVAYYYHTENDTSTLGGFPAVDSDLFVSSFSSTTDEWDKTGSTPYLGVVDGSNLISIGTNISKTSRWFSFADTSSEHTSEYATELGVYVLVTDGNDRLEWKIDTTGDNIAEYQGSFNSIVGGWNVISISSMTTKTEINNARISLTYNPISTNNTLSLDAVKLAIARDSTAEEDTCFETYCRLKVSYDVTRSKLDITVSTDGGSRIFKADYPDDFTINGSIPQLFTHEKAPDIFFSSYLGIEFTASIVWIDFIEAPYKENEWRHTTATTDLDWLSTSPFSQSVQPGLSGGDFENFYELTVPSLDSISGTLNFNLDNFTATSGNSATIIVSVEILAVDRLTGESESFLGFQVQSRKSFASTTNLTLSVFGSDSILFDQVVSEFDISKAEFSINLFKGRSEADLVVRLYPDTNVTINNFNGLDNRSISDLSLDNPSQEFIIKLKYFALTGGGAEGTVTFGISNFAFLERDIFADVFGFLDTISGNTNFFTDLANTILRPLFDFLATISRYIVAGIIIGAFSPLLATLLVITASINLAITTVSDTLGPIISEVATILGPIITAVGDFLDPIITAVADVLGLLLDEVITLLGDLADEVIVALVAGMDLVVEAFLPFFTDVLEKFIELVGQFINDVVDEFLPFLFDIWDAFVKFTLNSIDPSEDLYNGLVNIIDAVDDAVTSIISLFTFIGDPIIFAWFVIFAVAIVFTFTAVQNQDPRTGHINITGYVDSMTRVSMGNVNRNQALGFTIFIPFILILYVIVKILIAEGTFPDIFGNLPI